MRKYGFLLCLMFLWGCASNNPIKDMHFAPQWTGKYVVSSWYKITAPGQPLKVYIEGDGQVYSARGYPVTDPTPRSTLVREWAAEDDSPNVVYLARPCQYTKSLACRPQDWTTGRFSQDMVDAMDKAVALLMKKASAQQVVLIGYAGGAQMAGLIAVRHPAQVKKLMTVAGVLDYEKWTEYSQSAPLNNSVSLSAYRIDIQKINQVHYVGQKDDVVPLAYVQLVTNPDWIVSVKGATHEDGYGDAFKAIRKEQ